MPSGGGTAGQVVARMAAVVALCGAVLAGLAGAARAQVPDVEASFLARIAAERQAAGRSPLSVAGDLVAVARGHSATMAAQHRLHHNPDLATQVAGWLRIGENVGSGASVDAVHSALMASATHRDEILGPAFTEVGVGVVASDGMLWLTQVFRLPEGGAAPAPPPQPAPPAPAPPATWPSPAAAPTTRVPPVTAPRPAVAPASTRAAPATTAPAVVPDPPPLAERPAVPAAVALRSVPVAASGAVAVRPGLVAAGSVAAGLLWLVAAGLVRSPLARRSYRRA